MTGKAPQQASLQFSVDCDRNILAAFRIALLQVTDNSAAGIHFANDMPARAAQSLLKPKLNTHLADPRPWQPQNRIIIQRKLFDAANIADDPPHRRAVLVRRLPPISVCTPGSIGALRLIALSSFQFSDRATTIGMFGDCDLINRSISACSASEIDLMRCRCASTRSTSPASDGIRTA